MVQDRYQRDVEPPDPAEGFSQIDVVPFERDTRPRRTPTAPSSSGVMACCWAADRTSACRSMSTMCWSTPRAPRRCARYQEQGFRLLGLSWQPEIGERRRSIADVDALFARMNELMGLAMEVEYCPHAAGPPRCWCRKPLPGLGVLLIHRHRLDPAACIYVGGSAQDPGFARRLGFTFRSAADFFAAPPVHAGPA